ARDQAQIPCGRRSRPGTGSIRRPASPCDKISIPVSSEYLEPPLRVSEVRNSNFGRVIAICVAVPKPRRAPREASVGSFRFRAAADRKLTDGSLDVEFDSRHLFEQIDIGDPDRTAAEPHVRRHQVKRLHEHSDVLQYERIGDRAVLPWN